MFIIFRRIVALCTVKAFGTFNTERVSLDSSIVDVSATFVFNIVPSTESASVSFFDSLSCEVNVALPSVVRVALPLKSPHQV